MMIGEEVEVILTIFNPTSQTLKVSLKCSNRVKVSNNTNDSEWEEYNGLCVCGLTSTCLGVIESNNFIEIPITIYSLRGGLFDLVG